MADTKPMNLVPTSKEQVIINSEQVPIDKDQVTIVFVTYNSCQLLGNMLRELGAYNVLIYDNASSDDTVSKLEKDYPLVRLHSSEINSGYGRAANNAFRQIDTPYAFLINPDVEVHSEQIDAMIASIQLANSHGDDWLFVAPETGSPPEPYQTNASDPFPQIQFAGGCALLINLTAHWRLDGFDENIFLFYEETDLCKRAVKAKIKMYYADHISFQHAAGQSVKPSPQLNTLKRWHYHWSYLYFCKKHHQWVQLIGTILKNVLIYPIKIMLIDKDSEKSKIYRTRRSATLAFIKGRSAFTADKLPYIPAPV